MKISEWDRDLIRRRLNNYRIAKRQGPKPLPLKTFLHKLLISGVTKEVYPENGDEPDFKEEALRRFQKNTQHTDDDKVFAIQQFLIHEKFLKEKELGGDIDPEYLPGLLAVHDYLGNKSKEAIAYLSQIKNTYSAKIDGYEWEQLIQLNFILNKSDAFFRVEEICEITTKDFVSHDVHKKDAANAGNPKRRGFGFVSTRYNIIYIFLHNYIDDNPITYIQAELHPDTSSTYAFTLIRSGHLVPRITTKSEDPNPPIILNNVLWFVSDPAKIKVHKEHLFLMTTER